MSSLTPGNQQESASIISSSEKTTSVDISNKGREDKNNGTTEYPPVIKKEPALLTAFENVFVGMAVADSKADLLQYNRAFSQVTGFSIEELSGGKFFSIIHPEDVAINKDAWNKLLRKESTSVTLETRYQNKLTEAIWARNSYSLIGNSDGRPENIMIVSVNISEEKRALHKAEEITKRFRFLADSMPQQIWTADANGNLNYFSQSFYEYSGMTFDQIKGSNWLNLVLPEDVENTETLWRHSVQTGEEFVIEHRLKRKDGNFTWQLSKAMAQRSNQGDIIMWVGSTSNIHRQKTVEEELEKQVLERTHDLQQANFNLKYSNHDLEQFAYIATHDLQEPLRKIRTYSSWINKKYLDALPEEAKDYVIKIENASEQMSVLIDDLLNYSLLLRPQEEFETTDLNTILKKVLQDFNFTIREKKAVITSSRLPQMKVIPMQIYQLFQNLISNSLKFSSVEREPVISIQSRIIPEEEVIAMSLDIDFSYVEIAFKDNGIGFLQEYAEKIFSIFQRLNSKMRYPGTGIGLALCRKIMEFHHGLIHASSKENEGASFYVLLPF